MNRKDDHVKYALMQKEQINDFDRIRFIHNALPSINELGVDLSTSIAGIKIPYPIYINAMTGGTYKSLEINKSLAMLANHFKIPFATGSLSIALKDPSTRRSFEVARENNKSGILLANIGADKNLNDARDAIGIINADLLQIHLNLVQEMIMPEGDRSFNRWEDNIKEIVSNVDVPVIVKEVGFGISTKTAQTLKSLGIKTIDVAGNGGTNFAIIENMRRENDLSYLNSWGLSTVESLLEVRKLVDLEVLASGGIRNPLDVIKALYLGASAVGMSGYFLKLVTNRTHEESINIFSNFLLELKTIMTILNSKDIASLKGNEVVFDKVLQNFINQRK